MAFVDGTKTRGRPGRRRRRHPAERRARPHAPGSRSTAASSSTTTWRRRSPTSSPSASASSTTASATAWSRRSSNRARCWPRRITGNKGPTYTGTRAGRQAQDHGRRRVLGRRVGRRRRHRSRCATKTRRSASTRSWSCATAGWSGVILVGDTADNHRYMEWLRTGADLTDQRRHLLFPPPAADAGLDVAEMADTATVCGCVGVTKGDIIQRDPRARRQHAVAAEGDARAPAPAAAAARKLVPGPAAGRGAGVRGRGARRSSARCVPFAEDQLREILREPAAQVGAGGARHLRQRHGLRGLQAGAQLHARHAVVRRPRRGPLGALSSTIACTPTSRRTARSP